MVLVIAGVALASATTVSAGRGPLETAIFDSDAFSGPQMDLAFSRTGKAGASKVRVQLKWGMIAPRERPADFDPTNPEDSRYDWSSFDGVADGAIRAGLQPIANVVTMPSWARRGIAGKGPGFPDHDELAAFMGAAARRYSGDDPTHPRIRFWQIWNEPNLSTFLSPQLRSGRPIAPAVYRRMVNGAAKAIHAVRPGNIVVAGGLAPFRDLTPEVLAQNKDWGPLTFMRSFLCLSRTLRPTCAERAHFDVWATHPYTSGGPQHEAVLPDDVSLGDLPEMRRVLDAGMRAGNIESRGSVPFWVTEFSWDSKGPDPEGVPTRLHTRWVAEAMYRMWKSGVSLVTWFSLRDQPLATSFYQSGLYYRGSTLAKDRPKPALRAFRFPVVAVPSSGGVLVWGRTPAGMAGKVVVHQSFKGGWKQLAVLASNRHGLFQRRFAIPRVGSVRATFVTTGEKSVPFGVKPVADRFFNPFGQTRNLEPKRP